jgi:hypothetical protein
MLPVYTRGRQSCITAKVPSECRQSLGMDDVDVVRTGFIGDRRVGLHFDGKSKALNQHRISLLKKGT